MKKHILYSATLIAMTGLLNSCSTVSDSTADADMASIKSGTLFTQVNDVIPFEDRLRRKWDTAVIADLDQNGFQDVIITEHGNSMKVFWNENGVFSDAQRLSGGDQHGITASDFDRDGRVDVIVAQGGGDGANPKKAFQRSINKNRKMTKKALFDYFQKARGRATKFIDPNNDGVLDLFLTGFPLPAQNGSANHLYQNIGNGKFNFLGDMPHAKWLGYRSIITDFNNDMDDDVLFFGGDNMVAAQGGEGFKFSNQNKKVLGDLANISDASNVVEIDYDNDGDFDLFITRSEAQFDIETYYDPEHKHFAFLTFRKKFQFEDLKVEGDLHIENLQMTYPHFNVFVGADKRQLKLSEKRHGNREINLTPDQAKGWPQGATDAGLYIGYMGDGMWRIGGESRSRLAAVVNNVVSSPATTPQELLPAKLYENKGGVFVDATAKLGINISEQTTAATAGDFNNDGFTDLAILRYGDMAKKNTQILLMNQGGKSFKQVENHGIISNDVGTTGGSIVAFDYNLDGMLDLVFSNERGRWHLMKNAFGNVGNSNFTIVTVGNSPSGKATYMGATLSMTACGQIYRRRVGAGPAAFSQNGNQDLHVGLGKCAKVTDASVRWTNGETQRIKISSLNKRLYAGQ